MKFMAGVGAMLLTFLAGVMWKAYERSQEAVTELRERVMKVEEDNAKWGTLAELHNKVILLDREIYRIQGIQEYVRATAQGAPAPRPEPLPPLVPPDPPKPQVQKPPKLVPPDELFKSPEDYRQFQQQKYAPQGK